MSQETTQKDLKLNIEENLTKEKSKAGAIIALICALIGIILVYFSFMLVYEKIMAAEMLAGRAEGEPITDGISVSKYVMPVINDIVLLGGAFWAGATFGFIRKEKWAWSMAIIGNVLSLLSFFMLVPAIIRGIPPIYFAVFVPNLIAFFLLLTFVRKIDQNIVKICLLAGMAYVMSFMNGVASTDLMLESEGASVFLIGQRLSWVGALLWASFVISLLHHKEFVLKLGVIAAMVTLVAGFPIGMVSAITDQKFSMFLLAPILSLVLLITFIVPKGNKVIADWVK